MNRLQKKCLIGSVGFHLLLLVILFVGPALASRQKPDDSQAITIVTLPPDIKLTDKETQTGGSQTPVAPPVAPPEPPKATPPPEPPKVEPPPEVKPPEPEKSFIKKIFEPESDEPDKPEKAEPKDPDISKDKQVKAQDEMGAKKKTTKPAIEVASHKVKVSSKPSKPAVDTSAEDERKARAAANAAWKKTIAGVAGTIDKNFSTGTEVSIPGRNGATLANYGDMLAAAYYQAWILPNVVADENGSVKVKVTVGQDGTIISARVTQQSGDALLDKSVEQALRRVKSFRAFPDGVKDAEQSFYFDFQPKFRRLIG